MTQEQPQKDKNKRTKTKKRGLTKRSDYGIYFYKEAQYYKNVNSPQSIRLHTNISLEQNPNQNPKEINFEHNKKNHLFFIKQRLVFFICIPHPKTLNSSNT